MNINYELERLLNFALKKNLIDKTELILKRNLLLDLLTLNEPYAFEHNEVISENLETVTDILDNILDYCYENKIIHDNSIVYRDLFGTKIMGLLTPDSKTINDIFYKLYNKNKQTATDYFYKLSKDTNYIQVDRIKKNKSFNFETSYGELEITINLSKPEKDPKDIEKAKDLPQTSYPKCLLCIENEGFAGDLLKPARQNLRLIRLKLNNDDWYFQYSPYLYYNEHSIVINQNHVPMIINKNTFFNLLEFLDFLPDYFIGSNSDIPIVGGSILNHDHYQAGKHTFPMENAKIFASYKHNDYLNTSINLLRWPLSVIRINSTNKSELVSLADKILNCWKMYEDKTADIIPYTNNIRHNAITPIARLNKEGLYELDLVLRNNRTTKEYPYGIFHPHDEHHHIKKENIGLIEVMGLAILPSRLSDELFYIKSILKGDIKECIDKNNIHYDWIMYLIKIYGTSNDDDFVSDLIKKEVGTIFLDVLLDAGVFKNNDVGDKQFDKFMKSIGCL